MAKVIATISGIGLVPGVSKNRRWYTPEMVERATARLAERVKAGTAPANMLSFHAAGDNSREIAASLTGARLDEGRLRFDGAITATDAGRDIASLADTTDARPPHLKNVSIRGYWLGTVRKVKGPDGQPVETADDLEIDGIDWTRSPGVTGAEIDTFAWVKDGAAESAETTERVAIYESVQEARVSITEEAGAEAEGTVPAVLAEAVSDLFEPPHVLDNGICVTCEASPPLSKRGSGLTGAGRQWADPGYQADKKQRYDLSTKANAKAAWSFVNQADNAKKYTPQQLKRIKGKIKAALTRFGVKVAAESADWADGWTFDAPAQVSEALAEHLGMQSCAGSWSVRASNGPVDICLSSYSMDPEDLDIILRAAADAACKALAALDPDMDGDVDLPGVGGDTDPDGDAPGETAPAEASPTDPAASPAAATTETEDPAMADSTSPAAGSTPAIDPTALSEAVSAALEAREAARRARKAEKRAARESAAASQAAANAALGQGTPAAAGATATETAEQREARLKRLVDEQYAAAAAKEGLAVAETDEQIVARLLEERLVPLRQGRAEQGGVQRKGIAALESLAESPQIGKQLQEASNDDLRYAAGAAYGPRGGR